MGSRNLSELIARIFPGRLVDAIAYNFGRLRVYSRRRGYFPGCDVNFDVTTRFKYPERIQMGDGVLIGPYATLGALGGIIIEDEVRISQGVFVETATLDLSADLPYPHVGKPVRVGRGAWLGANSMVLGGVVIGEQAVVAAGAVVTHDVEANTVVAGVPARPISRRPGI